MLLFYAVICLCLSVIFGGILMIAGRNPQPSKWAGEFMLADLYVPLWLCLPICGAGLLIRWALNLNQEPMNWLVLTASAIAVGATIAILKSMRVGKRLAAYAAAPQAVVQDTGAVVVPFTPLEPHPEKPAPQPVTRKAA